jgi:hypothetical protein
VCERERERVCVCVCAVHSNEVYFILALSEVPRKHIMYVGLFIT